MIAKRITSLTPAQQEFLPEFREQWRRIGLTTGPTNRGAIEPVLAQMYAAIGKTPVPVIILPSPRAALLAMPIVGLALAAQSHLHGAYQGHLRDQLGGQLWDQLGGQLGDQLGGQLRDHLWDQLGGQLWDQLGGQLWDQLGDQLWGRRSEFWGHCEAYWLAFYRFCEWIGCRYNDRGQQSLSWWETLARHCGWWWPYGKVIFVSDRPTAIRWNTHRLLHAEDTAAIEFSDGYRLWALNGVRVPEALVTTPAQHLDPAEWVLQQPNAEIRREAVRKIGIERVCAKLGAKTLDRRDNYELLTLALGDGRIRPYLKMRNPSLGIYHVEGVPPTVKTIKEALTWRNQTDAQPAILT